MAREIHTQFAMKALDFAGIFNTVVGSVPIEGTDGKPFTVELSAPDGPSTGGGKQSVQHVKVSRPGLVLVAGSADQVAKTAELRSYDYLAALHAQRFRGEALPLSRASYDDFCKRARELFATQALALVVHEAAPVPAAAPQRGRNNTTLFLVAVLIAIGVGAAAFFVTLR